MTGFSEKECVSCERCGAFIPKMLTQFHQCMGSDLSRRPANISLEDWLRMHKSRGPDLDRWFDQMISAHAKATDSMMRSAGQRWKPDLFEPRKAEPRDAAPRLMVRVPGAVISVALVLLGVALGLLVRRLF